MSATLTPEQRARQGAQITQLWGAGFGVLAPVVVFGIGAALQMLDVPALAGYVLGLVVVIFAFAAFLRLLLISRQPEKLPIRPYRVLKEPLAGLDAAAFNEWRRELMLLDFEPIGGCRVFDENGSLEHRVYDVWAHPTYLCYAAIEQVIPYVSGRGRVVRLKIWSGFGDQWWYGTLPTVPNRLQFMLRNPRTLWTAVPESGIENMLRIHLELREDVVRVLEQRPVVPLSLDSFMNGLAVQYAAERSVLRSKNLLKAAGEFLFYDSIPHDRWNGYLTL